MPRQEGSEGGRGYSNRVVGKLPLEILDLENKTCQFGLKVTSEELRSYCRKNLRDLKDRSTGASEPGCGRAEAHAHTRTSFLTLGEVVNGSSVSSPDRPRQDRPLSPTPCVQVEISHGLRFLV